MVKIFGLSLVFWDSADFKRVFNNLSIIKNIFFISFKHFKGANF